MALVRLLNTGVSKSLKVAGWMDICFPLFPESVVPAGKLQIIFQTGRFW
jgi:hypothetical protein